MRITEIEIKNFRGFYQAHPISLDRSAKNALIYGENGSGKSSLFQALKQFLSSHENSLRLSDYRNIFSDLDQDGYIKLTCDNGQFYEWSASRTDTNAAEILTGYKFSGFLEYRDILKTHYLTPNEKQVNLFDLLISILLTNIENPLTSGSSSLTFGQQWRTLQNSLPANHRFTTVIHNLNQDLQVFSDGLNILLNQLESELTNMFSHFEYNKVTLKFEPVSLVYRKTTRKIEGQEIILNVKFSDQDLRGTHPHYLNEAKLSAIGISIYLAALKLNPVPVGDLAILVLDDVLIGLDMSNRLPIIDIIDNHFSANYQIFLMTYDREWFETLCDHFPSSTWKAFEFYCADDAELELPIFSERSKGRDEYIARADKYFIHHDYKAAAVYARSAYEAILKFFCNKHHIPIPYYDKPKELKADDMWQIVKTYKRRGTSSTYVDPKTAKHIEIAVRRVLNPLSHSRPVSAYRREVQHAISAVKRLHQELQ